ncbi:hypothetical protein KI614_08610 [Dechloromonas denitrificans]|uniref:hypothetical protein n=1 Tax=Dechloromonas denitrificans TaxID=281362 RepID=UPI001CF84134|nr:hypothetical protein [Dechloromonas denitrificans]UCV10278.1 hypothetical protein KI614_08610 [Dechloromonas denitrificans]
MDRRQFVQTLSALAASSILPTTGFAGAMFSGMLPKSAELLGRPENIFNNDCSCRAPRIGVIAVGSPGGEVLTSLYGRLPHLDRSIAIDNFPLELDRVEANRKILVSNSLSDMYGGKTMPSKFREHYVSYLKDEIAEAVANLDLAFIVVKMGSYAGTIVAPIVAEVLRNKGITSICAAITLFHYQEKFRRQVSLAGMSALKGIANAVVPISSEALAQSARRTGLLSPRMDRAMTAYEVATQGSMVWPTGGLEVRMTNAFRRDDFLKSIPATTFEQIYRGVTSPLFEPGLVTVDLESIEDALSSDGHVALGYGHAVGVNAAEKAALTAISHPLLGMQRLRSASSIFVSIEGPSGKRMKIKDVNGILNTIRAPIGHVDHGQLITFGATYNQNFADEYRVTILADGVSAEGAIRVL